MITKRRLLLLAAGLTVGLFLVAPGMATESICPGGSAPRADITWCSDFDNLANCTTGQESQCWQDNYYGNSPNVRGSGNYVITSGGGAVGSGYVRGRPQPGGTGSGYNYLEPVPGFPSSAVNFRYYIRYSRGYLSFDSGHNIQMEAYDPVSRCFSALKFQLSTYSGLTYYPTGCGVGSFFIPANKGLSTTLRNNRWYLIEVQGIMDTACTDITAAHGCNGIVRVWIDEQLVTEYTDLNLGGVATAGRLKWGSRMLAPEMYYHALVPPWSFEVAWDNFAVSNSGTYIGPAANENPRGTGDPSSPYRNYNPMEAFLGHPVAADCSPGGYLAKYAIRWRSGGVLQSTITHGSYVDTCNNPPATDQALQVTLTSASDGGGVAWEASDGFPQSVIHGWMYLPSSNNYAVTSLALSGFYRDYWAPTSGYVALSVSGGQWAIAQNDTGGRALPPILTGRSVTFNTWHEYELILWNDNSVSLMIDRARVLIHAALTSSAAWMFSGFNPGMVVGVINFQGAAPFTVYYDDVGVATVSFWSCDGWGTASCPFDNPGALPAPSSLTVK